MWTGLPVSTAPWLFLKRSMNKTGLVGGVLVSGESLVGITRRGSRGAGCGRCPRRHWRRPLAFGGSATRAGNSFSPLWGPEPALPQRDTGIGRHLPRTHNASPRLSRPGGPRRFCGNCLFFFFL